MAFNSDQLGMAIFLLIAVLFNVWFIFISSRRAFSQKKPTNGYNVYDPFKYKMVQYSVLAMSCFDIVWVWLCMVQCWNNTFNGNNSFNQSSGNDSFGCQFMGWYSSFSLVSMMGSHCLVVNYVKNLYHQRENNMGWTESNRSFLGLCFVIFAGASVFASFPLIQGDGYKLTSGGFCYSDFTNTAQSSVILSVVLFLLALSGILWWKVDRWPQHWYFYAIFFATWFLWVPATSYGIANGEEIPSPYMIIGAIVGHGNAIVNPLLYGIHLFRLLDGTGGKDLAVDESKTEGPKIETSGTGSHSREAEA
jgi:hypothetical protein